MRGLEHTNTRGNGYNSLFCYTKVLEGGAISVFGLVYSTDLVMYSWVSGQCSHSIVKHDILCTNWLRENCCEVLSYYWFNNHVKVKSKCLVQADNGLLTMNTLRNYQACHNYESRWAPKRFPNLYDIKKINALSLYVWCLVFTLCLMLGFHFMFDAWFLLVLLLSINNLCLIQCNIIPLPR